MSEEHETSTLDVWHQEVDAAHLDRRIADVAVTFIGRMSSEQVRKFTEAASRAGMTTFELAYALAEKTDPQLG